MYNEVLKCKLLSKNFVRDRQLTRRVDLRNTENLGPLMDPKKF